MPSFTLIGLYSGISGPKKKNKNRYIFKLYRPTAATPLLEFSVIYTIYAAIWFVNKGFILSLIHI